MFSLLVNSKTKMSGDELNYAIKTLIKLTNNSAQSLEYINTVFASAPSLEPIYLKYLDELRPDVSQKIMLKTKNEHFFSLCMMQFKNYQYQTLLDFFKHACVSQNGTQLFTIELFMNEVSTDSASTNPKTEFLLHIGQGLVHLFNNKPYEANCEFKKALCNADNTEMEYLLELISTNWTRELLIHRVFEELSSYSFDYSSHNDTLILGKSLFSLPNEPKYNNRLRTRPDLSMLKKSDKVMYKTFNSNPLEAVLYYIDLGLASSSMNCMISCFISALHWNIFLLETTKTRIKFLAGRKVLKMIVLLIYELISKFSTPSVQLEAYKVIFSSLERSARLALSKFGLKNTSDKIELEIIRTCMCQLLDLAIINPVIQSDGC